MKRVILGTTVVILLTAVFSVSFAPTDSPEKRIKNKVKLDQTVKILNYTNYTDLDTIINITAQILKIKNVKIVCVPLNEEEQEIYFAYIQEKDGYYLIRVNSKLSEDLLIESICHEEFHIFQQESGQLKRLYYGFWYNGVVYPFYWPYFDREFELRAYEMEFYLKYAVKDLLYTTKPRCLN